VYNDTMVWYPHVPITLEVYVFAFPLGVLH
jgi:hypothetical protein